MNTRNFVDLMILWSALLFSLIGKDLGKMVFNEDQETITFGYLSFLNLGIISLISIFIVLAQKLKDVYLKTFLCLGTSLVAVFLILYFSIIGSFMIFYTQIMILAISIFSFVFREYFNKNMQPDFWKMVFESLIKIVQISLVVFVAVIATLRFVHDSSQTYLGFNSTIFYPTVIYIYMLIMFGFWVIYPTWNKLINAYEAK